MSCDGSRALFPVSTSHMSLLEYEKQFVLMFEKLPVLWDRRNQHYFNKYKRTEALEELLEVYRKVKPYALVSDVKKKINSLRSNYRRDLRKMTLYKKCGGEYMPKNWVFKYLHFLNEEELCETYEHQDPLDLDYDQNEDYMEEEYLQPSCSNPSEDEPTLSSACNSESQPNFATKRKYSEASEPSMLYQSEPKTSILAVYWTEKLQKLSKRQRIYAEKAINDILCEAELGNLNKQSVRINSSTDRPESTLCPKPSPSDEGE